MISGGFGCSMTILLAREQLSYINVARWYEGPFRVPQVEHLLSAIMRNETLLTSAIIFFFLLIILERFYHVDEF